MAVYLKIRAWGCWHHHAHLGGGARNHTSDAMVPARSMIPRLLKMSASGWVSLITLLTYRKNIGLTYWILFRRNILAVGPRILVFYVIRWSSLEHCWKKRQALE
jgi:hypothetical protein